MKRYFFTLGNMADYKPQEPEDAQELADDFTAHLEAQLTAAELFATFPGDTVVVRRANGELVSEVPIGRTLN